MNDKKTVSVLGSTGSIGVQTLDVISRLNDEFEIGYLTTNTKTDILLNQIKQFNPKGIVIVNENSYRDINSRLNGYTGTILCGEEGLIEAASDTCNDLVVSALVGFSGVKPTLAAIEQGTNVALANKETLVAAGEIITGRAADSGSEILAIDSEHSAVLQCIAGEKHHEIEKIILTASGGPFRNTKLSEFSEITVEQALKHPNWSMGSKITIDSATMMNKGFEVIEAKWLFGLDYDKIDVVIHPQSIIHSMVQFVDGSVKAQLGLPDMRIPISYALTYPKRFSYDFPRLDLTEIAKLEFHKPDSERYPCLELAYNAMKNGGNATTALNAANEIAVNAFLNTKIKFKDISVIISKVIDRIQNIGNPTIDDIILTDKESRKLAEQFINGDM